MDVRRIKEKDLQDLRALYIELCDEDRSIESIQRAYENIKDNEAYCLLGAEIEGKIVGTLMGIICYDLAGEGKSFMTIENVVVSPEYRGRGVCKSLFGEIENIAKQRDCDYIYFVSGKQRTIAHEVYSILGYADEEAKGFRKHL